jgi:hypothetical protein
MHGNAGVGIFDNGWNGLGWALPRADASVATLLEDLDDEANDSVGATLVAHRRLQPHPHKTRHKSANLHCMTINQELAQQVRIEEEVKEENIVKKRVIY